MLKGQADFPQPIPSPPFAPPPNSTTAPGHTATRATRSPPAFPIRQGDIFSTGYLSSGNLIVQFAALVLLAGGDAGDVDLNVDGKLKAGNLLFLELAISRGQIDPHQIDQLPPASRVFKSHMPPRGLPCRYLPSSRAMPS